MLALPPLRNINNERTNEMGEDFSDFSAGCNLLDSIDFDQLFDVGINEGDVLPDLEMDPEIFADFCEDSDFHFSDKFPQHSASDPGEDNNNSVVNKLSGDFMNPSPNKQSADKGKKASSTTNSTNKNAQGKRKVKVDWTPELHRRFVQAVEQLGVDKAVPSRILDLMGIQGLTRHNIASHLQKYRSHRKHMQAREAEAANWNQRRQVYRGPPPGAAANGGKLRDGIATPSWVAPTIGFPPVAPAMPPHFRPLHVWGHPSVDQSSLVHMWPKHIASSPPSWPPLQPSIITNNPSFWHPHHQHGFQRFSSPAIPGIPAASMYKVDPAGIGFAAAPIGQTMPKPSLDVQPTKESVDAALGDVLAKPWLPLPLGLRPPSTESVLGALQRQGSKIPTTT